jgi:uncharacterized protein (DUF1800 family)
MANPASDRPFDDPKTAAALALHRFGMGPRAGSIAAMAGDPRGALLAELDRPPRRDDSGLFSGGEAARAAFAFNKRVKAARLAARAERAAGNTPNANMPNAPQADAPAATPARRFGPRQNTPAADAAAAQPKPDTVQPKPDAALPKPADSPGNPGRIYREEAKARIDAALEADIGFVERLTWFWSNHFCVSADKGGVRPLAGAFEREAIRPHVLGRFADMLMAVETHPAMLIYLDNARSIGPDSPAGLRTHKGLNENLAREILELHTLGVRTVYNQGDVTHFANVITGWTVVPLRQEHGGEFTFNPNMHEPGAQQLIGKPLPDDAFDQGRAALAMLARHPATARHIATKLVRHFVSDQPVPALADKLAKRFTDTGGDLKEVAKTLVTAPESWTTAWTMADRKLKRPGEWIVAALRTAGTPVPDISGVMRAQNLLGEPLWRPASPAGFSDDNAAWIDGLAQRLDIANELARRLAGSVDPEAAVETGLGPLAADDTRTAIRRAESRPQALTLLFMAPEFQRR